MIDGTSIGIGSIKAAYFKHNGKDYYAFAYDQNGEKGYFDLNGQSLKKAFLKAPLKYRRISSRFSYHRYHPVLHRYLPHLGVDFAAPTGTPVHAVGDGVIEVASYNRGNGRYIKIRHNNIYETEYLHLSRFARGIHRGKTVSQGQLIGYVGSTGLATGPHLDYRIWKNGREVNPLKTDLPSSDPVEKKNMDSYKQHMALLLSGLNSITFRNDDEKHLASNVTTDNPQNPSMQDNTTL
jgi:murein DD-endopeptidase MepM/ murein hydrolase activator NlpD